MALLLLRQTGIMFALMLLGVYFYKTGVLTDRGSKEMGAILVKVVIPVVILRSCLEEYSDERLRDWLICAGLAVPALVIAAVGSRLVFGNRHRVESFAATFGNTGFVGVPLVGAALGEEAVFYLVPYLALMTLLQWTYGVFVLTGDKRTMQPKKVLFNPVLIALVLGLVLFVAQVRLPGPVDAVLGYLAGLNAPLAMLVLGVTLARENILKLLTQPLAWLCIAMRGLLLPLATYAALFLLPVPGRLILPVTILASAVPVGANVVIFSQQNGLDGSRGAQLVCLSTLLSVVTIPLLFALLPL